MQFADQLCKWTDVSILLDMDVNNFNHQCFCHHKTICFLLFSISSMVMTFKFINQLFGWVFQKKKKKIKLFSILSSWAIESTLFIKFTNEKRKKLRQKLRYHEWFFLSQLSQNCDGETYNNLIHQIVYHIDSHDLSVIDHKYFNFVSKNLVQEDCFESTADELKVKIY